MLTKDQEKVLLTCRFVSRLSYALHFLAIGKPITGFAYLKESDSYMKVIILEARTAALKEIAAAMS